MSKRGDYDIRYTKRISDNSKETKKKVLFQVNAIISDKSNEASLSASKLAFLQLRQDALF